MKCKYCGKKAGFFKRECDECIQIKLISKQIKHDTNVIKKNDKRTKEDSEYLAICNLLDNIENSPDRQKKHKIVMDILLKKYPQHHSDVTIYLAVKTGVTKLTPKAKKMFNNRHQKNPEVIEVEEEIKEELPDGVTVTRSYGNVEWRLNDELHKVDGPARKLVDGYEEWYLDGKLHREDGPAITHANNDREWFVNGKRHREGGSAEQRSNGEAWWVNGKRHRKNGPAVIFGNGDSKWFINGKQYTKEKFEELMDE
jgi:hypothetical protein